MTEVNGLLTYDRIPNVIDAQHSSQRELYNLTHDPREFTNLADLPEHKARVGNLHQRMLKELGANPDETEKRSRDELSRGYIRLDPKPDGTVEGLDG